MKTASAIVVAAGSSKRMGTTQKKEYLEVDGCPVLALAIAPFLGLKTLKSITVAVPRNHIQKAQALLEPHLDLRQLKFVEGGVSRQKSVSNALESLVNEAPSFVLIHDGARPWVTPRLIERVLGLCHEYGACIPVCEIAEAPKIIDTCGYIVDSLDRKTIRTAQTPQGFTFTQILDAHRQMRQRAAAAADDAEIFAACIGPVMTIPGDPNNKKITFREDLDGS